MLKPILFFLLAIASFLSYGMETSQAGFTQELINLIKRSSPDNKEALIHEQLKIKDLPYREVEYEEFD